MWHYPDDHARAVADPHRHRRGRRAASIAIAIFGGTTPYLQTWMSARFGATSFAFCVMAPSGHLVDHGLVHAGNPRAGAVLTDHTEDFLRDRVPAT
jgi:hypothetical protein